MLVDFEKKFVKKEKNATLWQTSCQSRNYAFVKSSKTFISPSLCDDFIDITIFGLIHTNILILLVSSSHKIYWVEQKGCDNFACYTIIERIKSKQTFFLIIILHHLKIFINIHLDGSVKG